MSKRIGGPSWEGVPSIEAVLAPYLHYPRKKVEAIHRIATCVELNQFSKNLRTLAIRMVSLMTIEAPLSSFWLDLKAEACPADEGGLGMTRPTIQRMSKLMIDLGLVTRSADDSGFCEHTKRFTHRFYFPTQKLCALVGLPIPSTYKRQRRSRRHTGTDNSVPSQLGVGASNSATRQAHQTALPSPPCISADTPIRELRLLKEESFKSDYQKANKKKNYATPADQALSAQLLPYIDKLGISAKGLLALKGIATRHGHQIGDVLTCFEQYADKVHAGRRYSYIAVMAANPSDYVGRASQLRSESEARARRARTEALLREYHGRQYEGPRGIMEVRWDGITMRLSDASELRLRVEECHSWVDQIADGAWPDTGYQAYMPHVQDGEINTRLLNLAGRVFQRADRNYIVTPIGIDEWGTDKPRVRLSNLAVRAILADIENGNLKAADAVAALGPIPTPGFVPVPKGELDGAGSCISPRRRNAHTRDAVMRLDEVMKRRAAAGSSGSKPR